MRRPFYLIIAGGLAVVGVIALTGFYLGRPSTLRIAVVRDSEDAQLVAAISQNFVKDHEQIRLRPVFVNDASASAASLEAGAADLAIVRSDVRLPLNGQTLVVLHRNPALLLSTRAAKVQTIADLRGRSVGVVRGTTTGTGNLRLLETILTQYEIGSRDVTVVELAREQVYDALATDKVSAVLTVGAMNTQPLRDVVTAVTLAGGGEPVFIPVTEAKAMAQRAPVLEAVEIVRGAFGGSPPKPAEPFETLGVSVRLMAVNTMKDSVAGDITRLLFADRPSIAQVAPLAIQIEAPSTERGAAIPVHPGAAAFLDDEQETFFDKYSDAIYIGAMILSVLGSAAAAAASRLKSTPQGDAEVLLTRLLDLLRRARRAPTQAIVDSAERDADDVVVRVIAGRNFRAFDPQTYQALTFALEQVRLAIAERRAALRAPRRRSGGARGDGSRAGGGGRGVAGVPERPAIV